MVSTEYSRPNCECRASFNRSVSLKRRGLCDGAFPQCCLSLVDLPSDSRSSLFHFILSLQSKTLDFPHPPKTSKSQPSPRPHRLTLHLQLPICTYVRLGNL